MSKYCTNCGTQMPDENVFCTNCGTKFSSPMMNKPSVNNTATTTSHVVQDIPKPTVNNAINMATQNTNIPRQEYVQNNPTQQYTTQAPRQNAYNSLQIAQQEFSIGKEFMNTMNPSHNYIQAINHLQKASSMGVKEANVYMAIAYLSQAVEILKNNIPNLTDLAVQTNIQMNPNMQPMNNMFNNTGMNARPGITPNNNMQTNNIAQNDNGILKNAGKYVAAAAVGAVASSVLHSATASAAESSTPGNIDMPNISTEQFQPSYDYTDINPAEYIEPYTDSVADSISSANEFVDNQMESASEYISPDEQMLDDSLLSSDLADSIEASPTPDEEIDSGDIEESFDMSDESDIEAPSFDDSSDDGGSIFDAFFGD